MLESLLFFAIPAAVFIFFVVCLICFLLAKRKNKLHPDTYSAAQISTRKVLLIISATMLGMMLAMIISIMIVFMSAIAFM